VQVLNAALDNLLSTNEWDEWQDDLTTFFQYSEYSMQEFLALYQSHNLASKTASKVSERNIANT